MNKLYKYLPFDINCVFGTNNDKFFKKNKTYSLNELVFNSNNYDLEGFNDFVEHNSIKPILRPFEDLTKPLFLTKAAAEMIGMKEGEVVRPIVEFFKLVLEPCVIGRVDLWQWDNISYDENRKCVKLLSLNGNGVCLYEDWYLEISVDKNVIDEIAFDFLRAMKFAVGLNEEEYIKLI